MIYGSKLFWAGALERAVKTFAQALIASIGTSAVAIHTLDWPLLLATAATAGLLSVLTSLATPETAAKSEVTVVHDYTQSTGAVDLPEDNSPLEDSPKHKVE